MKILVICGSGIGTSLILEMNVRKITKELGIPVEISHKSLDLASSCQADIWIGTKDSAKELREMGKEKVIEVTNIMNKASLKEQLEKILL